MGKANPSPSKPDVARALLLKGTAFLHLDPRLEDVIVPPWFKNQPQLVLQVGIDMPVPIRDLRVDDQGVVATLSFNRTPFTCFVPWASVFALVGDDGKGMMWAESMPLEVAAEVEREVERMGVRAAAEADARADAAGQARPELRREEVGLLERSGSDEAVRPRRRAQKQGAKKHQPSVERVPRGKPQRKLAAPPSLEVIVGEGSSPPRTRIGRPSHLKLVK
jgi:hypothetical protein